jgi:hypothetical protein
MQDIAEKIHKIASFLKTLKTIGWAYFGVRSQHGHQDDFNSITLRQTVITGILVWLVFTVSLANVAIYVSS